MKETLKDLINQEEFEKAAEVSDKIRAIENRYEAQGRGRNHEFRRFLQNALSSWMNGEGPEIRYCLKFRVRLARNFNDYTFPTLFSHEEAKEVIELVKKRIESEVNSEIGKLELLEMGQLQPLRETECLLKNI